MSDKTNKMPEHIKAWCKQVKASDGFVDADGMWIASEEPAIPEAHVYVRKDIYDAERVQAESKTIYESGWLEAEGIISDLQDRAEKAELEIIHLKDVLCEAMAQLRWLNELENALRQDERGE